MLIALDVAYRESQGYAVAVAFPDWASDTVSAVHTATIEQVPAYEPGAFYRRELPCLLAVLAQVATARGELLGGRWLRHPRGRRAGRPGAVSARGAGRPRTGNRRSQNAVCGRSSAGSTRTTGPKPEPALHHERGLASGRGCPPGSHHARRLPLSDATEAAGRPDEAS
jgi:hypothetical protein